MNSVSRAALLRLNLTTIFRHPKQHISATVDRKVMLYTLLQIINWVFSIIISAFMHGTVSMNVRNFQVSVPLLAKLGTYSWYCYMKTLILRRTEWSTGLCWLLVNNIKMIQVTVAQIAVFQKWPLNPLLAYFSPNI